MVGSINESIISGIKVYPVPTKNIVNIEMPDGIREIRMINYLGDIVYMQDINQENLIQIPTSNYNPGVYVFEFITDEGQVITKKIVVVR